MVKRGGFAMKHRSSSGKTWISTSKMEVYRTNHDGGIIWRSWIYIYI